MIDLLKKKWVEWLVSIVLVLITAVVYDHFAVRRESSTSIIKSIDSKANKADVDQQYKDIKSYVDTQDKNAIDYIKQHAAESEQASQRTLDYLKSVDAKINILLNRPK